MSLRLLITTVAKKSDARRIASATLRKRLAACVQILPGLESHYIWKNRRTTSREFLLLAKTTPAKRKALEQLWAKLHPYDCPELVTLTAHASAAYARWVRASVR
ncbi:MAG: divalent-cation tolerance protein CutA [Verrucomicrobia bacterium]|nr:divalent-cation tolerance protein CutA [Verrucomicrobiota bacterium]